MAENVNPDFDEEAKKTFHSTKSSQEATNEVMTNTAVAETVKNLKNSTLNSIPNLIKR